MSVIKKW